MSWLRTRRPQSGAESTPVAAAPPPRPDARLADGRARQLIQAVYELAATVESDARSRDWADGDVLALFRDGRTVWSVLVAYGLLRSRHDLLRVDADATPPEWATVNDKLVEQVAGTDAAGVDDNARRKFIIARMLGQYDTAAAATAANMRRNDRDPLAAYAPLYELMSHGFGGPGSADELAARFEGLAAVTAKPTVDHIQQIYG